MELNKEKYEFIEDFQELDQPQPKNSENSATIQSNP